MCTFWQPQQEDNDDEDEEQQLAGGAKRSAWRRFLWALFVCKNSLLIVFGILGLITGSWISLSELISADLASDLV